MLLMIMIMMISFQLSNFTSEVITAKWILQIKS